ncbi:MAG: hypothetical protein Q4C65_02895 [Eubacteriales bacterium]|nr:hypothetical protein [Eubacteriales bacterium]
MADKTENIKTRLSFDGEAQYKAACKEINSTLKVLNSEMKLVTAEYKNNAGSADALKAKQEVLQKTYDEQAKKVKETEDALKKCRDATGENSEESKKLETQLNYNKAALANTENELEKTTAELKNTEQAADGMGDEVEESGKQAQDAESKFSSFGNVISGIGKALAAAVAAIGTAAVAAGKQLYDMATETASAGDTIDKMSQKIGISKQAYQEWDYVFQLCGTDVTKLQTGMKTLSGVITDAANGSETAAEKLEAVGLSIEDLNGKTQEEQLDLVITALQDMGEGAERTTAATDLLGKSATDMAALLNMSSEETRAAKEECEAYGMVMSDEAVAASAAFCDAQTKLQSTFTGMKNSITSDVLPSMTLLMNGLSDLIAGNEKAGEEIKAGVTGIIDSITEMIPQFVGLITTVAEAVLEAAPGIITALADGVIQAIPELLPALLEVVGSIVNGLIELLPEILEAGVAIILQLATGIAQALPDLIPALTEAVVFIVGKLVENIPLIIEAGLQLITGLVQGIVNAIPVLIEALPEIITAIINGLIEGLPLIIASAGDIMTAIIDGLIAAIPLLIEALPEIITAIVNGLITGIPQVLAAVGEMVLGVLEKLGELVQEIPPVIAEAVVRLAEWGVNMQTKAREVIATMINNVINLLKELPQKIWNAIVTCINKIAEWGTKMQAKAKEAIANVCTTIVNGFKDLPDKMVQIGTNVVQGIWNGINNAKDWILEKIKGFGDAVLDGLKSFFGINSPSTLMRDEVGIFLAQGIGVGFEKEMQNVRRVMQDSIPKEFDLGEPTDPNGNSPAGGGYGSRAAGGVVVNQYIYANETSYAGQQKAAAKNFRLIARTV